MEERRVVPRTRVLKGARIILNQRSSAISCVVRNLTNCGAYLTLATAASVPSTFELSVDNQCRSRRICRVVWRCADGVGVAFDR